MTRQKTESTTNPTDLLYYSKILGPAIFLSADQRVPLSAETKYRKDIILHLWEKTDHT